MTKQDDEIRLRLIPQGEKTVKTGASPQAVRGRALATTSACEMLGRVFENLLVERKSPLLSWKFR